MSILEALKQTKKGSLNYDRNWFDMGKIKEVLTECTSPPSLPVARPRLKSDTNETSFNTPSPPISPNKSFNRENVEEILNVINKSHDPFVSPRVLEAEKRVKDYEDAWIMKARSAAEKKRAQFEKEWDLLQQQAETQLIQLNLKQELEAEASAQKIHALQQARCEEVQERQQHLKERHRRYAQALDNKMREAEAKRQQQEQEEKKRHEEKQQRLGSILKVQQEVATVQNKVTELLASGCQYKQHLPAAANKCNLLMKYVEEEMGRLVQKAKDEGATAAHLQTVLDLNSKSRNALEFVVNAVDAANKKGKEEAEKQQEQQQQKDQQNQQQLAAAAAAAAGAQKTSAAPSQAAAATAANNIPTQEDEVTCCAVDAFKRFTELQDKLKQVENMYQPLVTNAQLKKYKFELQKAVNTPVNAISATSGTHLMDKLQRLHAILSGQSVETGGKRVTSSEHPAGGAFCKDLLAKKIVKQGDEQVSSNFESAFPTAAVAVGIWYSFSDAGELMLAHFYKKCPYLVPYYVPKAEGQSNEDYFKALGYNYADNTVEKQDKFLKRMSGLTRLYAAILITPPPQGAQLQHPHGIENAWIWLVRVMNMQPRPDITATLVFDFLQVTGAALMKTYNKQFIKLLQILCSEFVPKIERVTIQGAGGPVSRLKIYLESCLKDGKMKPPAGMLPNNFWQS